jgi:hypothetical protein
MSSTLARRSTGVAASIAIILSLALPADARRVWPVVGRSPGDVTISAECKPGTILRGLNGRIGIWLDSVQLICGRRGTADAAPGSDAFGGSGGAPFSLKCASTDRISFAKIDLTQDTKRVKQVIMYCTTAGGSLTRLSTNPWVQDSQAWDACGRSCEQSEMERLMAQQSCPNEDFVGITVHYGKDVNAIGFICDTISM